ncbi:PQQ-binding-like beta-propeller repeat protein, partial [Streptomyces sp. 150FB]|uniref:PQQ-binding-like beta-propeller repeat protein n=1 Tax=Streptomyces sp. 150FB TaxID=1576605 RepID=UPI0013649C63
GQSGGGRGLSRRGLLTVAAGGGVVLVGGGAAWWWRRGRESVDPAFRIPAAVRTPKATLLDPDAGDILVGTHNRDGKGLQPLWTVPGLNSTTSPPPLPIRDVIVFGASGGGLTALDVVNGKKRWSAPDVSAPGRYVSLSDRLVAAVGPGGKLVTFVPSTGEPKWTAPAGARSVLGADADAVYVVTTDDRIRAVDRSDATIRWTAPSSVKLGTEVPPRGRTAPGRLVVCAADGTILGVDTRTGREVWKFSVAEAIVQEPAIQGDRVYIGAADLTAHRISDGTRIWATESQKDYEGKRETWSPPTVSGGSVFAMRGGTAQRYDARKGTPLWDQAAMGDARSPVLLQGTCAWIIDDAVETVEALDMEEGRTYVSCDLDGDVLGFRADGNRVFVMTDVGLTALPVL